MEKKTLSPQKKKALSYANDRRNSYGENDKSSRKAIPLRKAGENRSNRRKAHQALDSINRQEESDRDMMQSSLLHDVERVGGWQKSPDMPLGEDVAYKLERRVRLEEASSNYGYK